MNKFEEFEKILAVIAKAIDVARQNPQASPAPGSEDEYVAWIIVNQLRQAGFKIVQNPLDPAGGRT
jgi:hypothetical protein